MKDKLLPTVEATGVLLCRGVAGGAPSYIFCFLFQTRVLCSIA